MKKKNKPKSNYIYNAKLNFIFIHELKYQVLGIRTSETLNFGL